MFETIEKHINDILLKDKLPEEGILSFLVPGIGFGQGSKGSYLFAWRRKVFLKYLING